jgi:pilus assembly protein Flp/PilA
MICLTKIKTKMTHFYQQEEGLALTEYLILLGIIAGGLIVIVGIYGTDLGGAWSSLTDSVFGYDGLNTQSTSSEHD